uniref:apelin receptor A-like n=1 Tax=Myxine glutinosa TaxID=7769 RepID=UPI00358E6A60
MSRVFHIASSPFPALPMDYGDFYSGASSEPNSYYYDDYYENYDPDIPATPAQNNCDYSEWPPSQVIIPLAYILTFLAGLPANIRVLQGALGTRLRARPIPAALLASLAAADLLFLLSLPLWATYAARAYRWPFGAALCVLCSGLATANMYAGVFSLGALAVLRCITVTRALPPGARSPGSRVGRAGPIIAAILVWAGAVLAALPAFTLATLKQQDSQKGNDSGEHVDAEAVIFVCTSDLSRVASPDTQHLWAAAIALFQASVGFAMPVLLLFISYGRLLRHLSAHFSSSTGRFPRRTPRLRRTLLALLAAFVLCWAPYHVLRALDAFVWLRLLAPHCSLEKAIHRGLPYALCLGYGNSCLNPLLYAVYNEPSTPSCGCCCVRSSGTKSEFDPGYRKDRVPHGPRVGEPSHSDSTSL